ncbi:MAG: LysR family transcriptional regulator [Gammaproteobacteria bacterium]|nr:LysR family transcriptional regulator [Gammaproteobacteria bacterium]NIR96937.1 LysR family transcriptional regulator [Gammaproteobacteria bacterium]NIT62639.1 LysR family transcriptional regulator [Gammaproteobacteria bacterium]NIV19599.1 LysR family transcriptional regulator [Gammaproteobacteria bacterium]NIX10819.1 LysR family transcriptional regulator [Gammaproteobacteria bacterium]
MDFEDLRAFTAVAERGSFSRAAEALFRTQPAVSKRVAALEEALGARLFDRIGHRITLTEAGRALLPRARRILAELDDSARAVTNLSGRVAGVLTVGTSHHVGLHRLPPVLRAYARAYPEVELDLKFLSSEAASTGVEHGELELALVTLPLKPAPALATRTVWRDVLYPVVADDHPLARARAPSAADLAAHPAVLPSRGTFTRETVERAFTAQGVKLNVRLSTNYLETLKMLVAVGLGWSVLPHTILADGVRALSLPRLDLSRDLGVVRHRDRTLSNAAAALIETLQAHADPAC